MCVTEAAKSLDSSVHLETQTHLALGTVGHNVKGHGISLTVSSLEGLIVEFLLWRGVYCED